VGAPLGLVRSAGGVVSVLQSKKEQADSMLSRLSSRLGAGDGHWRSVGTLMTGTISAQAIGALSMLVVARIYSPAEVGVLAFFLAVAGLAALLSTGKYDQAVFVVQTSRDAAEVAALAMALALAAALALVAATPLLAPALARYEATRMLDGLLPLLAAAIAIGGATTALGSLATQQRAYAAVARARLVQAITGAGLNIGLGLLGWSAQGLVVSFVAGQAVGVGVLAFEFARSDMFAGIDRRRLWAHACEHARFPSYLLAAEVLNYMGNNLVAIASPGTFGAAALGQFNLGQRVAALPIIVLGGAMGDVFRGSISPQHARGKDVARLFATNARRLAAAGAVLILPLLVAGPALFVLVFGPRWREAGEYMQIIAPMIFARFVVNPLSATLMLARWLHLDIALQALFIVAGGASLWIGFASSSFLAVVISMSVLQTLIYGIFFWVSYLASKLVEAQ
jgi:O-antigen/teichoic acid export membrane protein